MPKLIACFISFILLASPAHAVLLPSDFAAGGGSGDIYRFIDFSGIDSSGAWPTTDLCLSVNGGGYRDCAATDVPDPRTVIPYRGQAFVRYLTCAAAGEHNLWNDGPRTLDLAVYEVQGSDAESNFVRKQIGGNLQFDVNDGAGVALPLDINLPTTLADAQLQVKFAAVSTAPTITADSGFTCTIAITE